MAFNCCPGFLFRVIESSVPTGANSHLIQCFAALVYDSPGLKMLWTFCILHLCLSTGNTTMMQDCLLKG